MIDYSLSKTTDVYMQLAWQHASHGKAVAAPLNQAVLVGTDSPSSTANQTAALISLRHMF